MDIVVWSEDPEAFIASALSPSEVISVELIPGATIGMHVHETSSEIIYILAGQGKVLFEGEYLPLTAGTTHYCPKGMGHSLINDSDADLEFLAIIPEQ